MDYFANNRQKIFAISILFSGVLLSSLYMVPSAASIPHKDRVRKPTLTSKQLRRNFSGTFVRTATERPRLSNVLHHDFEKIRVTRPKIAELWNKSSIFKLKHKDKRELKKRRLNGMFDGMRVRDLEHLTELTHLPRISCKARSKLIVLVSSFCAHKQMRDAIRHSWGNFSRTLNVKVVFFLGQCENVEIEANRTGDIVQANFIDNYYNLTLKTLSRLRWFKEHCANSDLVLMSDDDVMVDTLALLNHFTKQSNLTVVCNRSRLLPILRQTKSKWYVPKWLLGGKFFPPHCSGFAYLFNSTVISSLYEKSLDMPYIFMDDAFITGFVTRELNMTIYNDRRFTLYRRWYSRCHKRSEFVSHGYYGTKMIEAWNLKTKVCGDV